MTAAIESAARMGKRAGELFVSTGIPSPNPFPNDTRPDLAQAWRVAYLAAMAAGRV